ncbi:MAG: hypothetical protein ABSE73_01735 [Planctomycetota bacterium]
MKLTTITVASIALLAGSVTRGEEKPAERSAAEAIRSLAEFGPVGTPAEAQAALEKAVAELGKTGGVLLIPPALSRLVQTENTSQGVERIPPLPELTKRWQTAPGITIIEPDAQHLTVRVPQVDGLHLARTLRMKEGESLPHWGTHPLLTLENNLIYGSISYLDWLQEPVKAGNDRRFYLPTVRGIRAGQFLNIHGGPGYGGGVTRAYVKAVGYDTAKKMHYLVADTALDHVAGAIIHNKSNTSLLHMLQESHNDNQTYDVKLIRRQYAHGDTYGIYCDFDYMSNVHSAAGDENGNCFGAFIRSMTQNNFHGRVAAVDWNAQQLTFTPDSQHVETLGDSRPLINLNPRKWITQGKVWIVPAESYWETTHTGKFPFEGKPYPTQVLPNPITGVGGLRMGGLIRGDRDCPWTAEVVGRYLALTEPSELVPRSGAKRWYEIVAFKENADGTKDLEIRRFWWGAKNAGSPTLYSLENCSWDGHLRPLSYAIAPGTYVNDVSFALPGGDRGGQRKLGLAPYGDQGAPSDFAKDDEVEQAIGSDPFKPQAFRVWMWEDVPGAWPSAVLDIANWGAASRYAALQVGGSAATLEDVTKRPERKPPWDNVLVIGAAATVGLNFKAACADAAILFQQPDHEQPIKWYYGQEEGKPPKEAVLTVAKATGELAFQGGGMRVHGPLSEAQGLSSGATPARNLCGKNVPVKAGETALAVKFPVAEADADYAVFVEQTWLTNRAITQQTAEGFSAQFEKPAPEGAKLHWMLVR